MWFSWVAASLNKFQSVHSKQSCRAAVASSVHTLTVFTDGFMLFMKFAAAAGSPTHLEEQEY